MTFNLPDLKAHGFDVRDHHTNHNIEPGDVLITYPFHQRKSTVSSGLAVR